VTGRFLNWPTGLGFEYFYGFLAGEASQNEPNLVRNSIAKARAAAVAGSCAVCTVCSPIWPRDPVE
jgi:hypothetical protein